MGLVIKSGGGVKLDSGGDLTLTADDTNPSQIIFTGADYGVVFAQNDSASRFGVYSSVDGGGGFLIGGHPDGSTSKRFNNIGLYSDSAVIIYMRKHVRTIIQAYHRVQLRG